MASDPSACCTCASIYSSPLEPLSEKPLLEGRRLECCNRSICARCLNQNKRYESYCPYCQISSEPSSLPQGLRDPPAYSSLDDRIPAPAEKEDENPPAYSAYREVQLPSEKALDQDKPAQDVLHFIAPTESLQSLALAYNVPLNALRRTNNIFADHLIQGRKTLLIPGEYYKGGVSLSPRPVEGEEEELKKSKIRKFMVACKVAEYDVALLYLQQSDYDLELAIDDYREDERWEKEHPLEAKEKAKKGKATSKTAKDAGMRRFVGSSSAVR